MVKSYITSQGWSGFNNILAQLDLSPVPYYTGCQGDAGAMSSVLSQSVNAYTISLAEHDIYGSSRLGTKNYKPGQIYASWDFAQGTYDTLSLLGHRPWYSGTYNSLVDTNIQSTATGVVSLLNSYTGLRQYELSNHLGNVQATISDEPYLKGTNGTAVAQRSPALAAAYDYYPFGMLMPNRFIGDTGSHCVLVNRPTWVNKFQTDCHDNLANNTSWLWANMQLLNNTQYFFLSNNSLIINFTQNTAAIDIFRVKINANIGQTATISMAASSFVGSYYAKIVETVNGVDQVVMQQGLSSGASLSIGFTASLSNNNSLVITAIPSSTGTIGGGIGSGTIGTPIPSSSTITISSICISKSYPAQQNMLVNVCDDAGDKYRYGFNGKEKLNEWSGMGNAVDFGARIYDSRIGRFLSVDPLADSFVWQAPYISMDDNPIMKNDPTGAAANSENGDQSNDGKAAIPIKDNKENNKTAKLPDGVLPLDAHQAGKTYGVPTPTAYFTNPSTSTETAYVIRENDENGVLIPVQPGQVYTYRIEGAATSRLGVYKVPDFGSLYLGKNGFQPNSSLTNLLIRFGFDHGFKDANWIKKRKDVNDMKWVRLYNIVR